MKTSLKKKYIVYGSCLIIVFLTGLFMISYLTREPLLFFWNRIQMERIPGQILIKPFSETDWEETAEVIEELAYEKNVFITVVDEELQVLFSSSIRTAKKGTLGDFYVSILEKHEKELEEKGSCFIGRVDERNKAEFLLIEKHEGGYLLSGKSINGINSSQFIFYIGYFISAILVLLIGIPVLIWLVGKMTDPIQKINQVTRQMADLNFEEKVSVSAEDELGMLSDSVNEMSDKLKDAIEGLRSDIELRKTLVRNMAHELKTPIAVIMGYSENMAEIVTRHPEKAEKYCQVITDECERMHQIVNQMLEISSYEKGIRKIAFDGQELLHAVRTSFEKELALRKNRYEEKNELTNPVYGDPDVLQRALYNFVQNAVFYGKKEGRILVHAWEEEGKTWFSVYNEGSPISETDQKKIWDTFYKVDPARTRNKNSTGIGLAIVKEAVLAHDGEFGVKNVKDGVLFYFAV